MMLTLAALGQTVTARLTNLTRAGADLFVGDQWLLQVAGPPNKDVSVAARQNSGAWSVSTYGKTNASGLFELRGSMTGEHIGHWDEFWKVNGTEAPLLAFDVKLAPAPTPPPAPKPTPQPGNIVTQPATPPPPRTEPPPPVPPGKLQTSLELLTMPSFLFGLPMWVPLAGAAFLLLRKRR